MATEVDLGADAVYLTVIITAPRAGLVLVNASGNFGFNNVAGLGRCQITTGTPVVSTDVRAIESDAGGGLAGGFHTWSLTRAYEVAPGAFVVNLVCDEFLGDVSLNFPWMNAQYVPTRY